MFVTLAHHIEGAPRGAQPAQDSLGKGRINGSREDKNVAGGSNNDRRNCLITPHTMPIAWDTVVLPKGLCKSRTNIVPVFPRLPLKFVPLFFTCCGRWRDRIFAHLRCNKCRLGGSYRLSRLVTSCLTSSSSSVVVGKSSCLGCYPPAVRDFVAQPYSTYSKAIVCTKECRSFVRAALPLESIPFEPLTPLTKAAGIRPRLHPPTSLAITSALRWLMRQVGASFDVR